MNGEAWAVAATAATFVVMLLLETIRPLRNCVESKVRRVVRNLTTGGISLAFLTLLQTPILVPFARWCARHHIGLLNLLEIDRAVEIAAAVVLLDYTLWFWHRINHQVPFFWRFHLVHHADRDMDASTALRFHFGEQVLSIGYRLFQVALIGPDPLSLWIWQMLLVVSILFHHSNSRLPFRLERTLVKFLVTPRMHGIHHSNYRNETYSNFSSLLSAWDYLHGTILLSVPQERIAIGVPAFPAERDVTLPKILALPFRRQRDDWLGEDGLRLKRPYDPSAKAELEP